VPAAQLTQVDAPAAEYIPARQLPHMEEDTDPVLIAKDPAGQLAQLIEPVFD
jgi:hypothetical protein